MNATVEQMERDYAGGVVDEDKVGRPSENRAVKKAVVLEALAKPKYRSLVAKCESVYGELTT